MAMHLLATTAKSVGEVTLMAGAGAFLCHRGILNESGTRTLSRVNLTVLLPALLYTRLSASISFELLGEAWGLPFCGLIFIALGFMFAWANLQMISVPEDVAPSIMVGTAFGNATSLPIVLLTTIVGAYPELVGKSETDPISLLSLYLPVQHLLMWLLGFNMLKSGAVRAAQGAQGAR
eukprot:NODE_1306_length_1595_cov_29.412031_g1171_i0.p1 GENE.NODE_1306_length_1595_cov_29.412031_g1171_i0~~NODE_1306_length_1595_cov_29.412031_g1171_i0.p1  ORF type:complete len:201 (+),score=38.46 NODE_1306_length_1595_cov_29.412031_g1171_i0:70-603(+)